MTAKSGIGALVLSFLLPLLSIFSKDKNSVSVPDSIAPSFVTPEIKRLQAYLRLRTDHGNSPPAYHDAAHFINSTVSQLLPSAAFSTHEFIKGKPVLLVSLTGTDPSLPSLLLNSHTDVVPAESEKWTYDPFAARLTYSHGEWRIYARGSQDMKSVGMQYLEALAALTKSGWKPTRSVHVSFVPDEEIGGVDGMGEFVKSKEFQNLNVGVALDEGLPHAEEKYNVYYGERQTWWWSVKVTGSPGHGATFPETSASQILHKVIDKAFAYRDEQYREMNSSGADIGGFVGVNLAYLKAGEPDAALPTGFVMNMLPTVAEAGFDIRVPPTVSHDEMDEIIQSWLTCEDGELCPGVSHRFIVKVKSPVITSRDEKDNPFAKLFMDGLSRAGISERLQHGIFFAATDARYLREKGIPSFGFSPIEKTPNLLHKHDEFITMNGYHRGCKIYEQLIQILCDPEQTVSEKKAEEVSTSSKQNGSSQDSDVDEGIRQQDEGEKAKEDL